MPERVPSLIDPAELASIADLHLLARMVVAGLRQGLHRGARTGTSAEFAQYRPYARGDDIRFVDWRRYGRSDRLHVKEHQTESSLGCTLLLDCSASMDYGSGPTDKFAYARMLAACLAVLLHEQRDQIGLAAYDHQLRTYVPARPRRNPLPRLLAVLQTLQPAGPTDAARALRLLGEVLPPRGMVVLISDLLHPVDETVDPLRSLRARRHDLLVLQISDPAEQSFPFDQPLVLADAEDGQQRHTIPASARQQYLDNRQCHFARIYRECLSAEIDIAEFSCAEPLDRALHRFLQRRRRALLRSSRRREERR